MNAEVRIKSDSERGCESDCERENETTFGTRTEMCAEAKTINIVIENGCRIDIEIESVVAWMIETTAKMTSSTRAKIEVTTDALIR